MDGNIQLTFYEITPAPATPAPKVKIEKIPVGPPHHHDPRTADLRAARRPPANTTAPARSAMELLAIILGSDNLEDPAALLADNDRLFGLAQLPWVELVAIKGIGPTRAARLKAAFELGRRLHVAIPAEKPKIKSPADAANLLMMEMMTLEQEHLKVVILDTKITC